MERPEERLEESLGGAFIGAETISDAPRCARAVFKVRRGDAEEKQTVFFLSLPAGGAYGLLPVTARDATGENAARLTEIYEGCLLHSGDRGGERVVGAVNGGFFIFIERLWCRASRFYPDHTRVGDAIGWVMTGGETRFPPLYGRAALLGDAAGGWKTARPDMSHVSIAFHLETDIPLRLSPESINEPLPERVVCYTPCWPEKNTPPRRDALEAVLIGNTIAAVGAGGGVTVPVNGCVVSAPRAAWGGLNDRDLKNLRFVSYSVSEKGRVELGDVCHALEAGPLLVAGGAAVAVDVQFLNEQGFVNGAPPFPAFNSVLTHYRQKAPRVCAGIAENGDVTIGLFEGRMPGESEGVDLTEAAALMADAGCHDAVNLDGGASAEIILHGEPLNEPQLGADKKWLNRGLDFLNRHMRTGTLPRAEELGGGDERAIGTALIIVERS